MSPEAKQGYRMLWEEIVPFLYFGGYNGCIVGLAAAAYYRHSVAFATAVVVFVLLSWFVADWLHSTRWSGRPLILITAEAAKAIQDGSYALKIPPKEQLH